MITIDTFRHVSDPARARGMFKDLVGHVEIEIFSYCNRVCSFCPNSFLDRRGKNTLMDPKLYSKIMDDLGEIDYAGNLWFSRYNEPTADRVFLERLREARAKLPHAVLSTFTNGDYLDADYVGDLRDAGLNELRIMAYLPNGVAETQAAYLNLMVQRLTKLGLPWRFVTGNIAKVDYPGIDVTYLYMSYITSGTNRGALLETGATNDRQSPCTTPITHIHIDYNGAMVPCCEIRSDAPAHADYVVYRLTPENSVFEGYANSKLVDWRRSLSGFGSKQAPCDSCNRHQIEKTPAATDLYGQLAALSNAAIAIEAIERRATEVAA